MGMGERWRDEWQSFRRSAPGTRFRERYERVKCLSRPLPERIARCAVGIVTVLVGIVLIPLPGPGWLIVGFGMTMLAQESRPLASFCDRVELRFRAWMERWRRWRASRADARR
jgi:uncharacterized protein (TIGR02611 family)